MSEQVVCTIITKSYLPFARTLSYTLTKHNPKSRLYVLLADNIDGYFEPKNEPFDVIFLEELPEQSLVKKMCFYYTPFELCCALRGIFHSYIYDNKIADSWIFLDSDIVVYNSLHEIFQELETSSILLNPHIVKPVEQPYVDSLEVSILVSGTYNAGFLGLKRSEEARRFIEWFKDRLAYYSFHKRGKGITNSLFVDQLWLNFVPHFFNEVSFLNHPGANVAYWNLNSRTITKEKDTYFVNGKPLLFIHFSGWNISQPSVVSSYLQMKESVKYWKELGEDYQTLLLRFGYEDCKSYPYSFGSFTNSKKITPEMRYLYYENMYSNDLARLEPFSNHKYFVSQLNRQNKKSIFRRTLDKFFRVQLKV